MARYRTKPFEIEAIQYTGDNLDEIVLFTGPENFYELNDDDKVDDPGMAAEVFNKLHSTWVGVYRGQWIIKGSKGEFYPIDNEVFRTMYERIVD